MRLRIGPRLTLRHAALFLLGGVVLVAALVLATRQLLGPDLDEPALRRLAVVAGVELAILAALATVLGALLSRRLLAQVQQVTDAAQAAGSSRPPGQLDLAGPDDEIKELGDTFDEMLAQLDEAADAQRHFAADVGDQLRGPLTQARTAAAGALTKPGTTADRWRVVGQEVVASMQRAERLLDALVLLARSEQPVETTEADDLADLAADALDEMSTGIGEKRLRVRTGFAPAPVCGDVSLLARAVANLVENAVGHNRRGGDLEVTTGGDGRDSWVRVANSGPDMSTVDVRRLVDAFHRGPQEDPDHDGVGLGLSIAAAVARNHGGAVTVTARKGGGLDVLLRVPGDG